MKKRLRKKLKLGEFTELGFSMRFHIDDSLTASDRNAILEALIEFVEGRSVYIGGGGFSNFQEFFVSRHRSSTTPDDQEALRVWLESNPSVDDVVIGPLVDAWKIHPPY